MNPPVQSLTVTPTLHLLSAQPAVGQKIPLALPSRYAPGPPTSQASDFTTTWGLSCINPSLMNPPPHNHPGSLKSVFRMRTVYSPPIAAYITVITQTCKLSDLKTTPTATPTVSVGQESGLSCILCSGSHKAVVKVSPVSMLSWLWASVLCGWLEAAPGSLPGGPLTMVACFTEASNRESGREVGITAVENHRGSDILSSCFLCSAGYKPVLGPSPTQKEGETQRCGHQDTENSGDASESVDTERKNHPSKT